MKLNIHHIGYLVKNINKSLSEFENLGFNKKTEIIYDIDRDIDICFLEKDGYMVELISPYKNSIIYGLMKRYKNTAYHFCYKCHDLKYTTEYFESMGYVKWDIPRKAIAISDKNVLFLINPHIGIVELLEE